MYVSCRRKEYGIEKHCLAVRTLASGQGSESISWTPELRSPARAVSDLPQLPHIAIGHVAISFCVTESLICLAGARTGVTNCDVVLKQMGQRAAQSGR
jgi:hypothetical protein